MLDAACPGEVFTSPTPDQSTGGHPGVDGGAGTLHIVKNYTGDVMNFEMAADLARDEGLTVEQVLIDDDVAVKDSLYTAGRRGVGATVLAEKICGAAAEEGGRSRRWPASAGPSTGAAAAWAWRSPRAPRPPPASRPSTSATTRWRSASASTASPGASREPLATAARDRRDARSTPIVDDLRSGSGDAVLAFVNGMGGTPLLELYVVYAELAPLPGRARHHDRAQPRRLLHDRAGHGRLFDHAAAARRRAGAAVGRARRYPRPAVGSAERVDRRRRSPSRRLDARRCRRLSLAADVATQRDELTELDAAIGDADHGVNMDRGMQAVARKARRRTPRPGRSSRSDHSSRPSA